MQKRIVFGAAAALLVGVSASGSQADLAKFPVVNKQ